MAGVAAREPQLSGNILGSETKVRATERAMIRQQPAGDAEIPAAVHTSTNQIDP